jgi:hypothetical protein
LLFDLADSYLLQGEIAASHQLYKEAVEAIPPDNSKSVLSSVIAPLEDIISIEVLEEQIKTNMQHIVEELRKK